MTVINAIGSARAGFPFYKAEDYASPQAAANAAEAAGGGTVLLPRGPVALASTLELGSGVTLEGSGYQDTEVKPVGVQQYTLIRNKRAGLIAGANDRNVAIANLTIDGKSGGVEADGRRGYGVELYGVTNFSLEHLLLRNIPLSALEISGDIAAIANGVRTGVEPLSTANGFVREIRVEGAGWQLPFVTEAEKKEPWGDAGFGVIIRAGASDIDVQGVVSTDTYYGGFGVGQLSNVNSESEAYPNKAQSARITASGIHVNQAGSRAVPGAPSIRISFTYDFAMSNFSARFNAGSQGIAVRQAGKTGDLGIRLSNGWSEGNEYGLIQDGASAVVVAQRLSLSSVHCVKNRRDGFYVQDPYLTATACEAWGNERHNWNFSSPEAGVIRNFYATITGCVGLDASDPEAATFECGVQLKDAAFVKIVGGQFSDTREGAERTQNYGIRETGVSDFNTIIGVDANNNITKSFEILGANTLVFGQGQGPATPWRPLIVSQGQATNAAVGGTKYFLVPTAQNSSAPVPGNTNSALAILHWLAAAFAVAGRTTTLRLLAEASVLGVSPGVKVTVALYPLTMVAGHYELGAAVAGTAVELETTGKTNAFVEGSVDFAVPADGRYAIGYVVSGAPGANFGVDAQILVRNS